MIHPTFHLEPGAGRGESMNRLLDYLMKLPADGRFAVETEDWVAPLPRNLLARIKIPVRQLAKFNGLTYPEMNEIVHDCFYPKRIKNVGGVTYEVSIDTVHLTPEQARDIEAKLHKLAGDIGCKLTYPDNWTA